MTVEQSLCSELVLSGVCRPELPSALWLACGPDARLSAPGHAGIRQLLDFNERRQSAEMRCMV